MKTFFSIVLFVLATVTARADERWEPIVDPYSQIFPGLLLATSTMSLDEEKPDPLLLGDPNGYVGVRITAASAREAVEIVVRSPNLMSETRERFVLPKAGSEYELYPTLLWNFERLKRQNQSAPDSLNFEVLSGGRSIGSRSVRVRVRSVNDVPYSISNGDDEAALDFSWLFAAYVNEDHPIVDEILKEALESGLVESFDGYQSEDEDQVYAQVFAIWHVLQQRGLRYSSITRTANELPEISSQHVRLIDQSIRLRQANCADGTVLLASILRKIDIAPFLVLVPGHMFLGFYLDEKQETPTYLETTMMGSVKAVSSRRLDALGAEVKNVDEEESLTSFEGAVESATSQVEEAGDKFDGDDPDYQIIDIQAARELGVVPISS